MILPLIPKASNPNCFFDYCLISYCNTVYKCIAKILAKRIAHVLPSIVGKEQSAFIFGTRISDNILFAQELVHAYNSKKEPARCAMKVDIMKAFDFVEWSFLRAVLEAFNFLLWLVMRIMECVTTLRFSIAINRELNGFFPTTCGLRQGNPLFPILSIMVMEVSSSLMRLQAIRQNYKHHWRCAKTNLTNLCFVDDMLIFYKGTSESVDAVLQTLNTFADISGLRINPSKSQLFTCTVDNDTMNQILISTRFSRGSLLVCYMDIPLISSHLTKTYCTVLVDRIMARINHWSTHLLSYAG